MSAVTVRASAHTQVHHTRIKFTLFANEKDMADSKNDGFVVLDKENKTCKVRFVGQITDCKADNPADKLYDGLKKLICAVIDDYGYLITK